MSFKLKPRAEQDIEEIVSYIAADSPAAARQWFESMRRACERLAEMPKMGVARPEIRPDLRTFPVGNYLIAYREAGLDVEIVRILHGARQWRELL
ncbi:type II toxin-antitoxin system RelE/ParE family toxin [Methylocystis parvus]|uniref:Type II toxin-antitoxin system RelE/ParE family toxin n=1 Tax=Methylocystis parvus TaxID=134 RepID=A0A6B8LWF8_9HYPH|nr:type II toxin-antitoxin system RelE/ParE family toxin [Methylocystis parvus]QGM96697.1 type II toxin-antitoxin system RelE/ParE family toxin [Methylocystis parvus]WBJ99437.1 type II toxin-antitoxin system RelE/ParE family toxin [Methylocystis parvus OBBP]